MFLPNELAYMPMTMFFTFLCRSFLQTYKQIRQLTILLHSCLIMLDLPRSIVTFLFFLIPNDSCQLSTVTA